MRTGRPTANPAQKELMGTFRKDRHANIVALSTPVQSVPKRPGYLSKEARLVWDEEFPRVVGCGAVEADSSLFATYCELEAACRGLWAQGEIPKVGYITALRQYAELLGIAGIRSRLAKTSAPAKDQKPVFSIRPN